jgi:glycosyltransferase involved in cell wall biosynthesis
MSEIKAKRKIKDLQALPFVSICTPTFNRRPFIPYMIKCFQSQDYPKNRMEWIIIDDGTDKIGDLVKDIPEVKYFSYDTKMCLGEKRNIMHEKTRGDFIVYMDDDDFYPPDRVSHAIETLKANPQALCAGSSEMYIYFKHIRKMYQFGPYGPNHATAATFAFRKELLKDHRYNNKASLAEEKAFLKDYSVPFVQLDPLKSILVFSHEHNTFDKRKLLENPNPQYVKESDKTINMFIKDGDVRDFYTNRIGGLLKKYEPGLPSMKPDVLKQIAEIEQERKQYAETMSRQMPSSIVLRESNGTSVTLTMEQVADMLRQQQSQLQHMVGILEGKDIEIQMLNAQISSANIQISSANAQISTLNTELNRLNVAIIELNLR